MTSEPDTEPRLSTVAVWRIIRKHWLVVCLLTLVVGAGMSFYTLGVTKVYEAKATIMFDPDIPRPLGDQKGGAVSDMSSYWNNKEYYNTQHWMIRSMRVAAVVVKELELNKDSGFLDKAPRSAPRAGRRPGTSTCPAPGPCRRARR